MNATRSQREATLTATNRTSPARPLPHRAVHHRYRQPSPRDPAQRPPHLPRTPCTVGTAVTLRNDPSVMCCVWKVLVDGLSKRCVPATSAWLSPGWSRIRPRHVPVAAARWRPRYQALAAGDGRGSGAPTRVDSGPTGHERRRPHPRPRRRSRSRPHHRHTSLITASWLSSTRQLLSRRCSTLSAERYATASWTAPSSSRCKRRSSRSTTSDRKPPLVAAKNIRGCCPFSVTGVATCEWSTATEASSESRRARQGEQVTQ